MMIESSWLYPVKVATIAYAVCKCVTPKYLAYRVLTEVVDHSVVRDGLNCRIRVEARSETSARLVSRESGFSPKDCGRKVSIEK
jgi:hypothetical protein